MTNPCYFPEYGDCIDKNISIPFDREYIDDIRLAISTDVQIALVENKPGARELSEDYEKCTQCLAEREVEAFDKKFLEEIGIKGDSLYAPKSQEE